MRRVETHKAWKGAVLAAAILAVPAAAGAMTVRLDENTLFDLRAPAGTVLIGNPAIADVSLVSPNRVAILGRGFGETNVVITDRMGRVIFDQEVRVAPSAGTRVAIYRGEELTSYSCSPACARMLPASEPQEALPPAGRETSAPPAFRSSFKVSMDSQP